ncbi:hypothetical protein MASR1M60_29490 [Rhodocyclaceae bacterium]
MTKRRKPPEAVNGSYTPVPHALLDSAAFLGASTRAKALLFDLLRQHNGGNNGHLQLSVKWLLTRGWTSTDQIQKAKSELLERGLVIKTRLGGLGIGPDQYALTWLNIADFKGLELRPGSYYPGAWRMLDAPPTAKRDDHSSVRNNPVPQDGIESGSAVPSRGTVESISAASPVPPGGNNECCQLPTLEKRSRVVGKVGRSGVRARGGSGAGRQEQVSGGGDDENYESVTNAVQLPGGSGIKV